jgi:drug/metabolite transporter, DME family
MASVNTAFLVLAALFWGISGGIGGILTGQGWDPVVVSFYRGSIGFLFVLIWLVLRPAVADWQIADYGSGRRLPVWA